MKQLSRIAQEIEEKFDLTLAMVSGGNSANYEWFMATSDVGRINNLRLGESVYLGRETLHRKPIPGLFTDAFSLFAEVIESSIKPSLPYGEVCQDVSGQVPEFKDLGPIRRAVLGLGLQDVLVSGLTPKADISILGASSDHMIMNTGNILYDTGDEVAFDLNYGALLTAMTSPYVETMVI
jgi:predicted amino acid racemase